MQSCINNFVAAGFFFIVCLSGLSFAEQSVNISIATAKNWRTVSGKDVKLYSSNNEYISTRDSFKVALQAGKIKVNNTLLSPPLRFNSSIGVEVDGKKVKGDIFVFFEEGEVPLLRFIHPVPLESYVAGVVAGEMPKSWPLEALKAQAIAARTYALTQKYNRIERNYHLVSSVLDQVYRGQQSEGSKAKTATEETKGLVLTYKAKPIIAYFHSSCGGKTESAKEGWGKYLPYLPGGKCGYCSEKQWKYKIPKKNLASTAGLRAVLKAKVKGRTASGRAAKIAFSSKKGKKSIVATDLRQAIGYGNLRSTLIDDIERSEKNIIFVGRGYGHGVGMCQWGAKGMASKGYDAQGILGKYYPGAQLRRLY